MGCYLSKNRIDELLSALARADEKLKIEKEKKNIISNQIATAVQHLSSDVRRSVLQEMVALLSIDELTEKNTRLLSQNKIPLKNASSFQQLLVQATRRRQLFDFQPEWKLNNKRYAYDFIDKLGVKRPKTYAYNQPINKIVPINGSVLKPENGSSSHGVFIFDELGGVFEVRTGEVFSSAQNALDKATDLMKSGIIKKDSWLLEEFIGDFDEGVLVPPVDLKFYCFYGEVGFVLEVERANETRYCEWMPDGSLASTGRYKDRSFIGGGFSTRHLETARHISKEILTPFMRIDFIKSRKDFAFGEFTPRPGQFSSFNQEFDRYLGECYLSAEARLFSHFYKNSKVKS
ncbi:hypothetical protein DN062_02655 [Nitrincola tibetensis]|uniref:ATP-grasp domain-containing protein n=1 Tax=Nitrincola tibetensis TaxID=2219697 RepID=A0A364NQL6_9GAMM|nr:hypothetical protein DN062_02655 [Nitrincola tibetensis]